MAEAIEANYVPDGDDWTITITGRGKTLTAKAPGIIAARDRTDQLVEQLAPEEKTRTVVHLLNGDAVEFTTAYLTARMTKSEPPAEPEPKPEAAAAPEPKPEPVRKPTPSPRARDTAPDSQPTNNGAAPNPAPAVPTEPGEVASTS
jgi:outer membrane biosynthesis protein TonB